MIIKRDYVVENVGFIFVLVKGLIQIDIFVYRGFLIVFYGYITVLVRFFYILR